MTTSDLIALEFNSPLIDGISENIHLQRNRLFLVFSHESPGYEANKWKDATSAFDGSMTYSRDSTIHFPFGRIRQLPREKWRRKHKNYANKNKTKGAYTYISNCNSKHYNRLGVIEELAKYVHVSVMGKCTKQGPCPDYSEHCESVAHADYRFYLAFENSLCKDYITEKFWKGLLLESYVVPVVFGGLSIDEYSNIAPPNSFIHAYNFSSIKELGLYLSNLTTDDAAYDRYHEWRQRYILVDRMEQVACDLCKLAHNPHTLNSTNSKRFIRRWNSNCRRRKER